MGHKLKFLLERIKRNEESLWLITPDPKVDVLEENAAIQILKENSMKSFASGYDEQLNGEDQPIKMSNKIIDSHPSHLDENQKVNVQNNEKPLKTKTRHN